MKSLFSVGVLSLAVVANAKEFDLQTSPEVLEVEYKATHTVQVPFQIGESTLSIDVDCQATPEAALALVNKRLALVEERVKYAIAALGMAPNKETLGYEVTEVARAQASDPVANRLDVQEKKYFWTNRCTGAKSEKPFLADYVHQASAVIKIRFPNEGTLLSQLTDLVVGLEKSTNDEKVGEAKVSCRSAQGTNYDLSVTPAASKAAWEEVKKVAKLRAEAKQKKDAELFNYTNVWSMPEEFTSNSSRYNGSKFPVNVVEEKGEWVAKIKNLMPYTVYVKQIDEAQRSPDSLAYKKDYSIAAEVQSSKGIYATLSVSLRRACFKTKEEAETALISASDEVLAKLRAINGGQAATETDRLDINDVSSEKYSPVQSYTQLADGGARQVRYFYNSCTLETYEVVNEPEGIFAWSAEQELKIVSKDLKALKALKDELEGKFHKVSSRPDLLGAHIGWETSVTLEAQDELDTQFRSAAAAKFLAPESPFVCELNKFSFACLAKPTDGPRPFEARDGFGSSAPSAPGARGYNEKALKVDASERGLKGFTGTHTIRAIVRKVFK